MKDRIPREKALVVAEEIYEDLKPFCERIKVAGSLRRHTKTVADIEFLIIPKVETITIDFFGHEMVKKDLAAVELERWVTEGYLAKRVNANGHTCWGDQNKLAVHCKSSIPVDFFFTTPEKWFVSLVIRTGGKRTNLALTMAANKKGLTLQAYGVGFKQLSNGAVIPCKSEQDVFSIAGLTYVEPNRRQ